MIVALAGRRIDAPDAEFVRFPAANAGLVEERLRDLFRAYDAHILVGSAACGADLIAQHVAQSMHLERVIVLPYSAGQFRESSVVDRGGHWGEWFDELLKGAEVIDLALPSTPSAAAFEAANLAIQDHAVRLAETRGEHPLAVVVWDGKRRGADDLTAAFMESALARGLTTVPVSTLEQPRESTS